MKQAVGFLMLLLVAAVVTAARADLARVAVASNFSAPMKSIVDQFQKDTGHRVQVIFGSSGKLYAQIVNGAPFQVFLSADSSKPARLEQEGKALPGTRFTYARGALALWSAKPEYAGVVAEHLRQGQFKRLAIANDRLAPYGVAAREVLQNIQVWEKLHGRLVTGENIAQTYQFVSTGNADMGFIALSQAIGEGQLAHGAVWIVPQSLHQPILQDAVLLERGRDNAAAVALLEYLKSDKAVKLIKAHGYEL